jgi:Replication initiator protein A
MSASDSPTTRSAPASPADLRLVRSEVNFLTSPFFCLDNRWHTDRLKIEYHRTLDRGEGREEIAWRVLAHQEYGLPGPFDWELHKAIEAIINERGFPVRNPIPFSMRDVCRRMGITYSGRTAEAIKAAFLRITSTMVESKRTFYSKPKKRWIEDNFHLYDRVVYRGDELPDSTGPADTNYLFLGSWYLENLNALYVSLLDPHYRRSLSVALARRLYEILGVKFYGLRAPKAPGLRYAYSTVCALLPVKCHRYLSQAHRQLDPAHQELIATGFLERVEWHTVAGTPPEWYLYYVPGPHALQPAGALPSGAGEDAPLDPQEAGGAAISALASRARDLVSHFRQGLVEQPKRRPSAKELQQAEALIRAQGEERARAIVTYALQQALQTGFQMQHLGAILGYQDAALAELTRQAQQVQHQQEERQRQAAERHRLEQEREQEERAAAVLEQLSDAQREAYRQRARERLPALMRDMEGFVAMHMRYLVVEDGRVG